MFKREIEECYIVIELTDKDDKPRVIRISKRNYDILCRLGDTSDTFNDVMDRIFKDNNLIGIVSAQEE